MRILFITARFPFPPIKGDKSIPYQRLKYLSAGNEITLLSFSDNCSDEGFIGEVAKYCREVHIIPIKKREVLSNIVSGAFTGTPFQVLYYESKEFKIMVDDLLKGTKFDVIHVFMLRMAHYISEHTETPKIIELIDSMRLNMERRAFIEKGFKKLLLKEEARRISPYERSITRKFEYAIVVSEIDRSVIGINNIEVCPLGVDLSVFNPKNNDNKDPNLIVFTGNMGYFPNEAGVMNFVENIFPLIQAKKPSIKFWVVGKGSSKRLKRLAARNSGITITGQVDRMSDYINMAVVAVAPMNAGSGMQNKILEALACGVPVVATSLAKGSISLSEGQGLFVQDEPGMFADTVLRIMGSKDLRENIGRTAFQAIKDKYSLERSNLVIERIYRNLKERKSITGTDE